MNAFNEVDWLTSVEQCASLDDDARRVAYVLAEQSDGGGYAQTARSHIARASSLRHNGVVQAVSDLRRAGYVRRHAHDRKDEAIPRTYKLTFPIGVNNVGRGHATDHC